MTEIELPSCGHLTKTHVMNYNTSAAETSTPIVATPGLKKATKVEVDVYTVFVGCKISAKSGDRLETSLLNIPSHRSFEPRMVIVGAVSVEKMRQNAADYNESWMT